MKYRLTLTYERTQEGIKVTALCADEENRPQEAVELIFKTSRAVNGLPVIGANDLAPVLSRTNFEGKAFAVIPEQPGYRTKVIATAGKGEEKIEQEIEIPALPPPLPNGAGLAEEAKIKTPLSLPLQPLTQAFTVRIFDEQGEIKSEGSYNPCSRVLLITLPTRRKKEIPRIIKLSLVNWIQNLFGAIIGALITFLIIIPSLNKKIDKLEKTISPHHIKGVELPAKISKPKKLEGSKIKDGFRELKKSLAAGSSTTLLGEKYKTPQKRMLKGKKPTTAVAETREATGEKTGTQEKPRAGGKEIQKTGGKKKTPKPLNLDFLDYLR